MVTKTATAVVPEGKLVGKVAAMSFEVTDDEVRRYRELSGDNNPIHYDAAFARRTIFRRPVVPGGLVAIMLSRMVLDVAGEGWALTSISVAAEKPVFVGERLRAVLVVVEHFPGRPRTVKTVTKVFRENSDQVVLRCDVECIYTVIRPATGQVAPKPAAAGFQTEPIAAEAAASES